MGYSVLVRGVPSDISLHEFQIWLKIEVKSLESLSRTDDGNSFKLSLTDQQESDNIIHKTLQYSFGGVKHNITFENDHPSVKERVQTLSKPVTRDSYENVRPRTPTIPPKPIVNFPPISAPTIPPKPIVNFPPISAPTIPPKPVVNVASISAHDFPTSPPIPSRAHIPIDFPKPSPLLSPRPSIPPTPISKSNPPATNEGTESKAVSGVPKPIKKMKGPVHFVKKKLFSPQPKKNDQDDPVDYTNPESQSMDAIQSTSNAGMYGNAVQGDVGTLNIRPGQIYMEPVEGPIPVSTKFFEIGCQLHPDVIEYIKKSDSIKLSGAQVNFIKTRNQYKLRITTKLATDQTYFENSCNEIASSLVSKYTHKEVEMDRNLLEQKKKQMKWVNSDLNTFKLGSGSVRVFLRFTQISPSQLRVEISGEVNVVKMVVQELNFELKQLGCTLSLTDYRKWEECGCMQKVTEEFQSLVSIFCDKATLTVHLHGHMDDVKRAENYIHQSIKELQECKVILGTFEQQFLLGCLKSEDYGLVQQTIQDYFKKCGILASLQAVGTTCYLYYPPGCESGSDVLKELLSSKQEPLPQQFYDVVITPLWKGFTVSLTQKQYRYYVKPGTSNFLIIAGLKEKIEEGRTFALSFLEKNIKVCNTVPCSYRAASFLKILDKEAAKELSLVNWDITNSNGGGITVAGTKYDVTKAEAWIHNRVSTYVQPHGWQVRNRGFPDFFRAPENAHLIKQVQAQTNCLVLMDHDDVAIQAQCAMAGAQGTNSSTKMVISGTNVTISSIKADLTQHQCDVIVVPISSSLSLSTQGVAGAIAKKGGKGIVKTMQVGKNFLGTGGEAVISGPGSITNCKSIIHAVVPVSWALQGSQDVLKCCVRKAMQMANQQQAKSIAFPALCCGQGGGKPEDCISIMVHEITSYLRLNNSSIEEVHLVELNRDNVLKCFHNEVLRVCVSSITQPTNQASNQCTIQQITVIVKDITQQKADVIVNSTTSFAVNNVDGSALSRAIRDAAGKKLQVECNAIPPASKCTWGVVATKGYDLPCKNIYHAMIAGWDFSDENTSRSHLKRVVAKSLEMATKDGHTSIAFPPIGCGGFNIPPYVLAEVIQEEVYAIGSSSSLQNIYIVVHPSQPELTKVFEQKLNKSSGNVSQIYGNLNVEVCCGSIEEQHDDVIINSVTTSMDLMKSGKLSQSMAIKGGFVIKRQFHDMKRKYASPTIRVTDGGNLPCDVIIHGATSKLGIQQLVIESLKIAEEMRKSTVAIPALGTGAMGKPPLECAKLIKQGIIKFAKLNPVHVKNVKVVVFQNNMVAEFRSNLLLNSSVAPSTTSSEVVTFYLCGLSQADVDHAKGKLEDVIKKEEEVNNIADPCISKLDAEFEKDIILLNQKNVEVNVNKSKGIVEVRGVAKFSRKAFMDVQNILGESTQAETLREQVQWLYCLQGSNSFEKFGLRHNMQLEKSFKNDNNGKLTVSGLSIDFSSETGQLNNSAIQIFRKDLQKNFPNTWAPMKRGKNYVTPKVSESSQEYKDVKQKFITTGTPIKAVQQLLRIQNCSQYGQFQSKRDEVISELKANGLPYPPTRELFHGTTSDITEKICREGFNRSYAGENGIRFGKGMYFAVKSSYCHERNFAMPDNNNVRRMFLVEVATGEYAPKPGNESMITPPVRNPSSKTDSYHSVVDNPQSPEIFVVFKDACAYPHYLLTYT